MSYPRLKIVGFSTTKAARNSIISVENVSICQYVVVEPFGLEKQHEEMLESFSIEMGHIHL